jgi:hypothetical protein
VHDLEVVTAALGELIQEEDAMVRPRHVARQREVSAANQPHIRDGVMRGAKQAGGG